MSMNNDKLIQIRDAIKSCRMDLEKEIQEAKKQKPTFTPNKNLGEGNASKEEMAYRENLISPLEIPYNKIKKILASKDPADKKKKEVFDVLHDFRNNHTYQNIIKNHIYKINDQAINEANKLLKPLQKKKESRFGSSILIEAGDQKYQPDQTLLLSPLLAQQYGNLQNIIDNLDGDLSEVWEMCDINKKTRTIHDCELDEKVDTSFNKAQNRMDGMGWYGWFKGNELGILATLIMAEGVLGELVADWVSMGDENVCPDCIDLEAGSPYFITQWPEEPHFGCRCKLKNLRLLSSENN